MKVEDFNTARDLQMDIKAINRLIGDIEVEQPVGYMEYETAELSFALGKDIRPTPDCIEDIMKKYKKLILQEIKARRDELQEKFNNL